MSLRFPKTADVNTLKKLEAAVAVHLISDPLSVRRSQAR